MLAVSGIFLNTLNSEYGCLRWFGVIYCVLGDKEQVWGVLKWCNFLVFMGVFF